MNALRFARTRLGLALLLAVFGSSLAGPAWAISGPLQFFTITPCRVYDSRPASPLAGGSSRFVQIAGLCGVPVDAVAVALNVTTTESTGGGSLFVGSGNANLPSEAAVSVSFQPGKTRANNGVVDLTTDGVGGTDLGIRALSQTSAGTLVHFIVDVNGYFQSGSPAVANPDSATVLEDSGATTINVLTNDSDPESDPFSVTAVQNPSANGGTVTNNGTDVSYQPAANYCNNPPPFDTFTYTITGGSTATVSVTVTCVNDAPAGTDNTVSTSEDTDYVFTTADFGFTDPNDSPANALQAVKITTLPAAGSLKLSGGAVSAGQSIAVSDITAGNLKFTPATGASGSPYTTFTFQVQDAGGTANGGVDLDASANTMTVNVTGINNEPAGTDNTVTALEDTDYVFTVADFGFTDPSDTPANTLAAVKVTTLPGAGTLTLSGAGFAAGTEIVVADITAGNLKFTPAANASGSPYTSFTFQVRDNGGTAGGGVDLDATPNTMTVNVTAVNDAPAGTNKTVTTLEDTDYTFTAADFGFTDSNDTPANALAAVKITTLPALGSLKLSGAGFAAGTDIALADITAGNLKYSPAANGNGSPYTTFTFQVRDDGGTANSGVDLDGSANTMTVDVTAVNDAPAGTNKTVTTPEETQYTFTVADFGFTDPNDTPANALQAVKITTLPALGSLTLSGSGFAAGTEIAVADITAGNLKFTPAANGSGSPYTTFTFQVRDDGGTANSGVDLDASPNTLTVDVTDANDAPAGTDGAVAALEDIQYTFTVADFGFTDPNDSPANALQAVKITTLPGLGSLTLSGSSFAAGTEISATDITAGNLKFLAAANASGSPYTTFTFQVRDDGGTANSGIDLDATPNTLTVNVTAVNDAPAGTNNTVSTAEDAQYTFTAADFGFTDPVDSPANALQTVKITTLPGLGSLTLSGSGFAAGTEISLANITAGNLKFTPAANGSGSPYTTFTFQVRDNGGTANGGVDLDASANTMTVDVTAVNDAPAGTNNTVATLEGTAYTFTAADFGFTDPNDSPANSLLSVKITTLPGLGSLTLSGSGFAAGTEISLANITAGNLKFTPAGNGSGTPYTSFTFQVRDDGGTAGGGLDLDPTPNTMTVDVDPVNDAPAGTNKTVTALEDAQYTFTVADFGFTDPNDSPANALLSVKITTLPAAGSLTLSGSGFAAGTEITAANITAGNLKFTPAANASGSGYTSFTFQVRDDGGTANGGVDLDQTPNTITVDVTAVNDAPAGTDKMVSTPEDTDYVFTATDFGFTDPSDSPANSLLAVKITTLPAAGSLTLSGSGFAAGTTISLANITAGNLKFRGALNAFGSPYTSFTFQVQDNGGTANSGVDLDQTPNTMTIEVTPVNDAPTVLNESFDVIGNTELRVDLPGGTTPHASESTTDPSVYLGVLDNDSDVEGDVIKVTAIGNGCSDVTAPFDCTLSDGAVVHVEETGAFSFTPGPGDTSSSFTYTVTDVPAVGTPLSVIGTVTINVFNMVWYVDPAAGGGGNGTSISPFNSFASLNGAGGAGDSDAAGDYIFVHSGTLSGAIELEASQHLIGQGHVAVTTPSNFALSIPVNLNGNGSPTNLVATGTQPQLTNASGDTVKVTKDIPVEIVGLSLASTTGNAIDLTSAAPLTGSSTLTIGNNEIRGAGAEGIDINLNAGTTGTLNLNITSNSWNAAGTHTGNAVDINRLAGTLNLNFTGNTNIVSAAAAGAAVNINGGAFANTTITGFSGNSVHGNTAGTGILISQVTFDSNLGTAGFQQVDGDNLVIGASGNPVGTSGLVLSSVQGNLFFDDMDVFAAGTSGTALQVAGAGGGFNFSVTPATPDGSGTSEVFAQTGAAVDISSATVDLRLDKLTSTTSTSGLSLTTVGGQFRAPSGSAITKASGAGTAFSVASSSATVTYGGTLNVTSGAGVSLTSNTGSIAFTGTLTLSTGGSTAFNATGGGTVTTTDANSTLTTTNGTALNVANTTIGALGLKFKSVSAGTPGTGPASGIILNTTGASGSLTVLGTGTTGSGGTIQSTTSHGVSLTSTLSPSFDRMIIKNTAGSGIKGTTVTNFTFTNGSIDNSGTGGGTDDSNIAFNTSSVGTENNVSGTVSITGNTLSNAFYHGVDLQNFNGSLADVNISSNTITSSTSAASSNGSGIRLIAGGAASTVANVTKATISNNVITNFPSGSAIRVQCGNGNSSGASGVCGTAGSPTNIINVTSNRASGASSANKIGLEGILATVSGKGQGNFNVSNNGTVANPLANITGSAISVNGLGAATVTATVNNNVMAPNNTFAAAGIAAGVNNVFGITDAPDMTITINNNSISAVDGNGILAVARNSAGSLKAKIQNNTVAAPLSGVRPGIRVDSGTSSGNTSVCLNISGNTSAGSGGTQGIGLRKEGAVTTTNAFAVNGMAATASPGIEAYVNGLNPAGSGTLLISATSGFSNCSLP